MLVHEDWHRLRAVRLVMPYSARELDPAEGVMKKCALCRRIYNTMFRKRTVCPPVYGPARPMPAISVILVIRIRMSARWSPCAAGSI